jgi:2'-5' RNA ligase
MKLQTSVMIIMPPEVQRVAMPIIYRYASHRLLKRFPPHLTVHFPFVEYERLDEAIPLLRVVCAQIEPFSFTLCGYGTFPGVTYMATLEVEMLQDVFRKLFRAFPETPPYGGQFGDNPHPHVSVGFFDNETDQQAAVLPEYAPIIVRVTRFHVMWGTFDAEYTGPWVTEAIIPLGKSNNMA